MSEIKKHLELLHRETVISINTLQTKPFDYQKTQNMSDKKQLTTVELLYYDMISLIPKKHRNMCSDLLIDYKAMEKEQMIDAHIEGQRVFDNYQHTQWTTDQAEQYYNETYGEGEYDTNP